MIICVKSQHILKIAFATEVKMNLNKLTDEIISGKRLNRNDDLSFFFDCDLNELCLNANRIRSELCGNKINLCTIINAKSGKCSENCKFCAQSGHHGTEINEYNFLDENEIINDCKRNANKGVHRYSLVTAGRSLNSDDFEKAVLVYKKLYQQCDISLCASHGLLSEEQFKRLKECGVKTYHANIETSRRNFPEICTTHTYDDKLKCIKRAQNAGLKVCSGGIIGMGETWEDRLDMALSLSELNVHSIPLNALVPIKGTPFEACPQITQEDILRTIAIFRFINPTAYIRFAAGRSILNDSGKQAFLSGANAAITGDMLTTSGNSIKEDIEMLEGMGFDLSSEKEKVLI